MLASNGRWWLTQDSRQAVISASPDRIYQLVSDLPRMGQWSPECERVGWLGGRPSRPKATGSSVTTGAAPSA